MFYRSILVSLLCLTSLCEAQDCVKERMTCSAGGTTYTNFMTAMGYLPNVKLVTSYTAFTAPANGSQNDIYTVPAGKRAILFAFDISNDATGAASTFQPSIKISGTYYKLNVLTGSIATGAGVSTAGTIAAYVAEAGEIYSIIQTTQTTWFVVATIIEFDNTSPLKTAKVTGPVAGDNVLYTPSGSKNGLIVGNAFLGPGSANVTIGPFMYNATGAGIACNTNYLRGAAVPSTSNRITGSLSPGANQTAATGGIGQIIVANGDTISINLAGNNTSGLLWISVMEF